MTLKGIKQQDLPASERKGAGSKLTTEQIAEAVELLKKGEVVTDSDRTHKNDGGARRAALGLRNAILEAHPKLSIASRTWKDGEVYRGGVVLKEEAPKATALKK